MKDSSKKMNTLIQCQMLRSIVILVPRSDGVPYSIIGIVIGVNEKSVLIQKVDMYGYTDGFTAMRLDEIKELKLDRGLELRLNMLLSIRFQKKAELKKNLEEDYVESLLSRAEKSKKVVNLQLEDESIAGLIISVDNSTMEYCPLDLVGRKCPHEKVSVQDVSIVSLGSRDEIKYDELVEYHRRSGGEV